MTAADSGFAVERSEFGDAQLYFRVQGQALCLMGLAVIVTAAVRFPAAATFPWLAAGLFFLGYLAVTLLIERPGRRAARLLARASTTTAELQLRTSLPSVLVMGVGFAAIAWLAAVVLSASLWVMGAQLLIFGIAALIQARSIAVERESGRGQLLIRPRFGPNRSIFLVHRGSGSG